jgi:twitching motility protein PilI
MAHAENMPRRLPEGVQARLRGAPRDGQAAWLAVESGTARLLLPMAHAGEVFRTPEVQPVPYAQPWFLGVANLRGVVCGIVDLAAFLGCAEQGRDAGQRLAGGRLVSFNPLLEVNAAVLVDAIAGVRTVSSFVRSVPADATDPPCWGASYTGADGQAWREVNLQNLSRLDGFRAIALPLPP